MPAGVDEDVVMLRVLKHAGTQVPCENDEVTPLGKPDTDNETDCAAPLISPAVIMFAPELACGSVTGPPFDNEKSNADGAGAGVGATGAGADGVKTPLRDGNLSVGFGPSAKLEPTTVSPNNTVTIAASSALMQ